MWWPAWRRRRCLVRVKLMRALDNDLFSVVLHAVGAATHHLLLA